MNLNLNIEMYEVYIVVGMALVTFVIRYIMFPISGRFLFPKFLEQGLRYVPPVVLTAIIVPAVLMPSSDELNMSFDNPYLVGALTACIVGGVFKNLLLTIVISMIVFLGMQWILALGAAPT